jgi:hypothetical protein
MWCDARGKVSRAAWPLTVFLFLNHSISEFANLSTLGIIETVLGLYTEALIDRLFGAPASKEMHSTGPVGKPD